jgi:hypothetical protein
VEVLPKFEHHGGTKARIGIALTPVSGDTLRDQGINTVNGLENITPSLEIENQFGSADFHLGRFEDLTLAD